VATSGVAGSLEGARKAIPDAISIRCSSLADTPLPLLFNFPQSPTGSRVCLALRPQHATRQDKRRSVARLSLMRRVWRLKH